MTASQDAIRDCVAALKIMNNHEPRVVVHASLHNNLTKAHGTVWVTVFLDFHTGKFPSLEFDEMIRGFKIYSQSFNTNSSTMAWDAQLLKLNIANGTYDFSLTFDKKVKTRKYKG